MKSSPRQRLMSRRTRTLVPVTTNLFFPKVVDDVQESLQFRRQKAKSYFNKNAKTLSELDVGQDVWKAGQRKKTWQPGKCLEKLSDRSYLVQTDREIVRREDLRPRLDADKATSTASSLIPEEVYRWSWHYKASEACYATSKYGHENQLEDSQASS